MRRFRFLADVTKLQSTIYVYNSCVIEPPLAEDFHFGYQVLDNGDKRDLAIRLLKDAEEKELTDLMTLPDHPNVVKIIATGIFRPEGGDSILYVATEPLLRNMLIYIKHSSEDLEKALEIFEQIAMAVAYLHNNRITNFYLAPKNILLSVDGHSVKVSVVTRYKQTHTDVGGINESRRYGCSHSFMAPELLQSMAISAETYDSHMRKLNYITNAPFSELIGMTLYEYDDHDTIALKGISGSADIFSLALSGFYIITHGRHPFEFGLRDGRTFSSLFQEMDGIPAYVPDFPCSNNFKSYQLINLICRMLNTDPTKRPSAIEVRDDFYFKGEYRSCTGYVMSHLQSYDTCDTEI